MGSGGAHSPGHVLIAGAAASVRFPIQVNPMRRLGRGVSASASSAAVPWALGQGPSLTSVFVGKQAAQGFPRLSQGDSLATKRHSGCGPTWKSVQCSASASGRGGGRALQGGPREGAPCPQVSRRTGQRRPCSAQATSCTVAIDTEPAAGSRQTQRENRERRGLILLKSLASNSPSRTGV